MRKSTFLQMNAATIASILSVDARFHKPIEKFQQLDEQIRLQGPYSSQLKKLKAQKCQLKQVIQARITEFEKNAGQETAQKNPAQAKMPKAREYLRKVA